MSNFEKEMQRDSDELVNKLPSRMEVHGHRNRKRKNKRSSDEEQPMQKKVRLSIPLILLVILLLLPGAYAVYLFNKENIPTSTSANGVGEEISFEEDNSNDTSIDHKDSSKTPVVVDDKKEDEENTYDNGSKNTDAEQKEEDKLPEEPKVDDQKPIDQKSPENQTDNQSDKVEQYKKNEEVQQEEGKVVYHTVKKGETLFRISMNYYKSQSGIEKIKAANGITANEIKEGQTLKIPLP
ncbi:LysM peptidoglycan-binding domain-containing protein [Lederbergia wuyishanensis]|uniref:LysM repeat protein n=1 Tax=Lederbergia wuyishanensis TaxID=1347903 RepID=A0ABU0D120_9BACI|nr:LysM peptidoglycan-binding domain-containing protein [Lederbergia wuyishanensis]MCJ8006704.1 LysM peptidoglycan-binding domain-containing protein [Lederbergia wuyishanensis]MDQ0342086.1 LysM repeat protein [Lederbergia wuyishanensis]